MISIKWTVWDSWDRVDVGQPYDDQSDAIGAARALNIANSDIVGLGRYSVERRHVVAGRVV